VEQNGLDLTTWLVLVGSFVLMFGVPAFVLERDRRAKFRQLEPKSDD
jgi:hypothetical protein